LPHGHARRPTFCCKTPAEFDDEAFGRTLDREMIPFIESETKRWGHVGERAKLEKQ